MHHLRLADEIRSIRCASWAEIRLMQVSEFFMPFQQLNLLDKINRISIAFF